MTAATLFTAGDAGAWQVEGIEACVGASLPEAAWLTVSVGVATPGAGPAWTLRGVTSNQRYTNRHEQPRLLAKQPPLDRPEATCAALIAIRKSAAWWALAQDERREILEERSHHIEIGLDYLPGVARRLYHSRDLGEPFDFVTWFEYPPEQAGAFDELLIRLRVTPEWEHVEREVDVRLAR